MVVLLRVVVLVVGVMLVVLVVGHGSIASSHLRVFLRIEN
jgi:hypothetical protein